MHEIGRRDLMDIRSSSLKSALVESVRGRDPELLASGSGDLTKAALLDIVSKKHGQDAVFELGTSVAARRENYPLFGLLLGATTPEQLIERWFEIERFAHPNYRTRLVDHGGGGLLFEHFALRGPHPSKLDDLFVAGLMVGLLERQGCIGLQAHLESKRGPVAFVAGETVPHAAEELHSHSWFVRWSSFTRRREESPQAPVSPPSADARASALEERLEKIIAQDLSANWCVGDAARGMGLSKRTLQRRLTEANVNFSELVQRARVRGAHELLKCTPWSVAMIANACGFSDHAHMTRTFRRHWDVPPSVLRKLMLPPSSPAPQTTSLPFPDDYPLLHTRG